MKLRSIVILGSILAVLAFPALANITSEAEGTLEGLQPGTHRIDFDIRATLKQEGQIDMPMRATP